MKLYYLYILLYIKQATLGLFVYLSLLIKVTNSKLDVFSHWPRNKIGSMDQERFISIF